MLSVPSQFGKWLVVIGLVLAGAGVLLWLFGRLGPFRLPGDIEISGKNRYIFIPITTCLLASALLTALLWLAGRFIR